MRPARPLLAPLGAAVLLVGIVCLPAAAVPPPIRTFVPIGASYDTDTLERFALAAAQHDASGHVELLVLPISYGTDAFSVSNGERQKNLTLADTRRAQIEAACNVVKSASQTCEADLVPVLTRSDTSIPSNLAYFTPDVDGMFVLGGDQDVAMEVVADTTFEQRMAAAYAAGAVVGGNSAGAAVQSVNMIAGFTGANGPENGFQQGSVDLWLSSGVHDPSRGLIFGFPNAITEQHIYQRGRIGRSVNVAFTTGLPILGMDADTAGTVTNETTMTDVVGYTSGFIVDPQTYGATGHFGGPTSSLSVRGIATQVLPPGGWGYDLAHLRPTFDGSGVAAPSIAGRVYPAISTPAGSGPLFLAGGIAANPAGSAGQRFVTRAGGGAARIVLLTVGYARSTDAQAAAKAISAALQPGVLPAVQWFVVDSRVNVTAATAAIGNATGIFVTAPDQSRVLGALAAQPAIVPAIHARWAGGAATLLADDAAASALGPSLTTDAPPTADSLEPDSQADFLASGSTIASGLGWFGGIVAEPRLLPDRHWGRLYHLVSAQPSVLGVGLDVGTALEVQAGAATVRGDSVAVVLDARLASLGQGSNGAVAAMWVVLDSFIDGETLTP
jgi:cyanophycinase-like exopeptidase